MYMGHISIGAEDEIVHELQGARILLTGLSLSTGVDIARAFARLKSRLVLHTNDLSPEVTEVVALVSQSAREIKLYTDDIDEADGAVQFARNAAQAFGGLDAVINVTRIAAEEIDGISSERDLEDLIAGKLAPLAHLTTVTANRMGLVLSEGLILNIVEMEALTSRRAAAVAGFARTALATMTKTEAQAWALRGIRVNAIAPSIEVFDQATSETDIAALAVYLTSRHGITLSGHVFDL